MEEKNITVLSPLLSLGHKPQEDPGQWKQLARDLGHSWKSMRRALEQAWTAQGGFAAGVREYGQEILGRAQSGERAVLLIGRPYNALDPGINMNVSAKLRKMGIPSVPLDCLPLEQADEEGVGDNDLDQM
jgi:predicted nucleotide-binding protein (sugar kinase/HSP70/actin superfamily)